MTPSPDTTRGSAPDRCLHREAAARSLALSLSASVIARGALALGMAAHAEGTSASTRANTKDGPLFMQHLVSFIQSSSA